MSTVRVQRRARYVSISNAALEDGELSFRARGILAWVLAKPDNWTTNSDLIAAAGKEGRDAVRTAMRELETRGYLVRSRERHGDGTFETVLTFHEQPGTASQSSADQSSVDQASYKDSEPKTHDQDNSSLRSEVLNEKEELTRESHAIASDYWEWFKAENAGVTPAAKFIAIAAVAKGALRAKCTRDEILDAMKREGRPVTAKRLVDVVGAARRRAAHQPSTAAIPSVVVRNYSRAEGWIASRFGNACEQRPRLMNEIATMIRWGFEIGETMIRLAVGLHAVPIDKITAMDLRNVNVPRFPGEIADLPHAMEAAYKNRGWRL